ncbi:hypothetical protein PENTCL1PPCAC_3395, partial [Pristionchus entomophagus]
LSLRMVMENNSTLSLEDQIPSNEVFSSFEKIAVSLACIMILLALLGILCVCRCLLTRCKSYSLEGSNTKT